MRKKKRTSPKTSWLAGKRLEIVATQVIGDQRVEPIFTFFRGEFFHERESFSERDVSGHLTAQRAMADRFETVLERLKNLLLIQIGELLAEALEIAEGVLVDEANESEQFKQRILERRRSQQQLVPLGERQLERVGDDV